MGEIDQDDLCGAHQKRIAGWSPVPSGASIGRQTHPTGANMETVSSLSRFPPA